MATVVLGCDSNGNDKQCQNTVAKILEKSGHTVEKLSIGPGYFAKYSYSSKAKGKIGVYLMAASLVSVVDLYGGNTNFKYAYFGIRGDVSKLIKSQKDFETKGIPKDHHGDCTVAFCDKWAGKTYPEINKITKSKCQTTFGATQEELGNALVKAMGGETDASNRESSGTSIKEALKKAVSKWDGDVEITLTEDTVNVNKIGNPSSTNLVLNEYENIIYDSITVTDVSPSTINTLVLNWKGYELQLTDPILIKRFGIIKEVINADDTVKTLNDAKDFLNREWNKLRRDNGRQVECKVPGDMKWSIGKWARTFLPSFYVDDYMYISKTSHEEDGTSNWLTSLTLVDYPPSFGAEEEEEVTEDTGTTEEEGGGSSDENS